MITQELAGSSHDSLRGPGLQQALADHRRQSDEDADARAGATKAGRDPSVVAISGYLRVAVTDDLTAGRASLQREISRYAGGSHHRSYFRNTGFDAEMAGAQAARDHADNPAMAAAIGEKMQSELGVVGPAEVCRARIEELRAMGLTKPVIAPLTVGDMKSSYEHTIKALAP